METNEAVKEYIESNKKHSFFEKRELTNVEQLSGGNANFVFRYSLFYFIEPCDKLTFINNFKLSKNTNIPIIKDFSHYL